METGGFISWDEWKPILRQLNCPCCMGVKVMPDGEELEQRVSDLLDKSREEVRDALLSLEIENMKKALEKTKAVTDK